MSSNTSAASLSTAVSISKKQRNKKSVPNTQQSASAQPSSNETAQARIAEQAYQLWESEGRPEGRASAHWQMAKAIIAAEQGRTAAQPTPSMPSMSA